MWVLWLGLFLYTLTFFRSGAKKDRFLNRFSGILRGNKRNTERIAATNRLCTPPVCQELACSRLAILYHNMGLILLCLTLDQVRNGVRHCLPQSHPNLLLCWNRPAPPHHL